MPSTSAVAREVVEYYKENFINHPVGTGPFLLPEYKQTNKITYTRNPKYRKRFYPSEASEEFIKAGFLKDAGRPIPMVDKIVVTILEESQPRWLNFVKGNFDFVRLEKDNFDMVVNRDNLQLREEFSSKSLQLQSLVELDVTYMGFNHDLELFKNKKLRQAMSLAFDPKEQSKLFYNDFGVPAQSIVPPTIDGSIKDYKNPFVGRDLEKAKALLAEAGYPEGKGLPTITLDTSSGTDHRQIAEHFANKMKDIGIQVLVRQNTWPELQNKVRSQNFMMFSMAWGGDYPDAENFLQLLYSKNRSPGPNSTGYSNPLYDRLYETILVMNDSPERTAIYEKMYRIAAEEVPMIYGQHRRYFYASQSWLKNYLQNDNPFGVEVYWDVDLAKKNQTSK
jgi:oligopeptide transport system substrate-binding protein